MHQVLGATRMMASLEEENVREYVTKEMILECRTVIEDLGNRQWRDHFLVGRTIK